MPQIKSKQNKLLFNQLFFFPVVVEFFGLKTHFFFVVDSFVFCFWTGLPFNFQIVNLSINKNALAIVILFPQLSVISIILSCAWVTSFGCSSERWFGYSSQWVLPLHSFLMHSEYRPKIWAIFSFAFFF